MLMKLDTVLVQPDPENALKKLDNVRIKRPIHSKLNCAVKTVPACSFVY
jgi:hypothetical protein